MGWIGRREGLIVGEAVAVQRQPVAEPGYAIGEVEAGPAIARIVSAEVAALCRENAPPKTVESHRKARTAEDHSLGKSEFQVRCRLQRPFHAMNERLIAQGNAGVPSNVAIRQLRELLSGKTSDKKLNAHRSQGSEKTRKFERADAVVAQHGDGWSIVAEEHGIARVGSPPQRLLPERQLVVLEGESYVGVDQTKA